MQGMLSQFKGLVVDWNHGQVKFTDERGASGWELLRLSDAFWRDLEWFDDHFEHRNCTSLEEEVCLSRDEWVRSGLVSDRWYVYAGRPTRLGRPAAQIRGLTWHAARRLAAKCAATQFK